MQRKGILLAGGNGTRLYPATVACSKHLLAVYDKPMIYYPLSILMLAGIREILIVSTERDLGAYQSLLGDGSGVGLKLCYQVQETPKGIVDGLLIGENFLNGSPACLILGDNFFYGNGFGQILRTACQSEMTTIFGCHTSDLSSFGVARIDDGGQITDIVEKPNYELEGLAIPGLYFYGQDAIQLSKEVVPGQNGELGISDLNKLLLARNQIRLEDLGRAFSWFDMGTPEGLLNVSNFVRLLEARLGTKVAVIEEIAWSNGWISEEELKKTINTKQTSAYSHYIFEVLKRKKPLVKL